MTATTLLDFGDEPYVLLTTFRANGDRVGTPVWDARDSDHLVVVTAAGTGKVGDGKIFIYDLEGAVRIRTGESGPEAL